MVVMLQNPRSGDRKAMVVGLNWSFLLFSAFLGLPLFFAGLTGWGAAVLLLWGLDFALPFIAPDPAALGRLALAPYASLVLLSLFLGFKGNGLIARKYFARGYDFAKPDSAEARHAADKRGLLY